MSWEKITKAEYFNLLAEKREELTVFESCTASDYVLTMWGFKETEIPFIRAKDVLFDEWEYSYFKWV